MNLNYSDEQNVLREQVLKFCETNYDFIDREKILDSDSGYSEENWKQFSELGWLAFPASIGVVLGSILFIQKLEKYYRPFSLGLLISFSLVGLIRLTG